MSGIGDDNTLDIDAVNDPLSISDLIGSYLFESLLYGVYIVLFSICIYLLLGSSRRSKWLYLTAAGVVFAATTVDVCMTVHYAFSCVLREKQIPVNKLYHKYALFVTNHSIALSILIYRCYVVWHCKKLVIIFPCILLLFTTMCGYALVIARSRRLGALVLVYLWIVFALNVSITALTAGKILWNARRVRSILGSGIATRYYSFSAIIVESGAIYSVYILLDLVVPLIAVDAGLIQVAAIIPTLVVIRVVMEQRHNETTPTLHSIEVVESSSTPVLDSIFSTAGSAPETEQPGHFDDCNASRK